MARAFRRPSCLRDSRFGVAINHRPMLMRTPLAGSGRSPPGFIRPALPVLATKVRVGDGWIHEVKHDGFRIVALKDGDEVRLGAADGQNRERRCGCDHGTATSRPRRPRD